MSVLGRVQHVRHEDPMLRGSGPPDFSTCTDLDIPNRWIADVNGYYRELGVDPRATRKELRLAYFEAEGQSSERLTYILKQLLNSEVRAQYDATPLGEVFLDRYVMEAMWRKAKMEALRQVQEQGGDLLDAALSDDIAYRLLREAGLEIDTGDDTPADALDPLSPRAEDVPSPAKFSYAYYLWRTSLFDETTQLQVLVEWQEHLVRAFSRRGVRQQIAVGVHGRMAQQWVLARVGFREVFFLHHLELPTADLADAAVHRWLIENTPLHREIDL